MGSYGKETKKYRKIPGGTGFKPVQSFKSPGEADRAGRELDLILEKGCEINYITC
jgi:hypothetical protein